MIHNQEKWRTTVDISATTVLTKARQHKSQLEGLSNWAEEHGRLHDDAVQCLRDIGVPRLYLPASLGGMEVAPHVCAQVCGLLADADPSAAWFVMVYNAARLMAATWPVAMVEAVWGDDPDTLVAASGHTPLIGERRGNGYFVSGQNSFVSGAHHAKYMMGPMLVEGELHTVVVPMSDCEIVPNWDTLGMRGTGSNDVKVPGVVVPEIFVAKQFQPQSHPPSHPLGKPNIHFSGTLYKCPARVVFATYVPVALSLARRALDELSSLAGNKVPYATDKKLRHKPLAQQHYGQALGLYRSAHRYFYSELENVWDLASKGGEFDPAARADLYLAGTHTMQACAAAVRHVIDAAGSSSLRRGQVLERIHRDMETLRHHGFANEARYANVAQVHWQAELDYPLLLR